VYATLDVVDNAAPLYAEAARETLRFSETWC
jgi:hypothetical protein